MIGIETLDEFIIRRQVDFLHARGDLSRLLRDIGLASKIVNREVNKAGLVDILGSTGKKNIQGEEVKKLDVFANERLIAALKLGGQCCAVASEENEDFISFNDEISKNGKYVMSLDPLDGSSNIDVNVSVGTIFSIYRKISQSESCTLEDFLQIGSEQIAAGYIIYGSSTMLVYTTGKGVNGFTLDPSIGEFCLSHPDIKIPYTGKVYSINHGNFNKFSDCVKKYINYCLEEDESTNRPYSLRYIGSMVADVHRNLLDGGIFIYPATKDSPDGKLRLLYECNPLAFIVEQAGGKASNGFKNILDVKPRELHQRSPIFLGSTQMVNKAEEFLIQG